MTAPRTPGPVAAVKGRPGPPARSLRTRAVLLAAFVMAAAGCGATPTERWVHAAGAFEYGVRGALAAHDAGIVSDDLMRGLDPVVEGANFALDAGYQRLPDGGDLFDESMDIVDAAILALIHAAENPELQP